MLISMNLAQIEHHDDDECYAEPSATSLQQTCKLVGRLGIHFKDETRRLSRVDEVNI
jgi:hypothetical protein